MDVIVKHLTSVSNKGQRKIQRMSVLSTTQAAIRGGQWANVELSWEPRQNPTKGLFILNGEEEETWKVKQESFAEKQRKAECAKDGRHSHRCSKMAMRLRLHDWRAIRASAPNEGVGALQVSDNKRFSWLWMGPDGLRGKGVWVIHFGSCQRPRQCFTKFKGKPGWKASRCMSRLGEKSRGQRVVWTVAQRRRTNHLASVRYPSAAKQWSRRGAHSHVSARGGVNNINGQGASSSWQLDAGHYKEAFNWLQRQGPQKEAWRSVRSSARQVWIILSVSARTQAGNAERRKKGPVKSLSKARQGKAHGACAQRGTCQGAFDQRAKIVQGEAWHQSSKGGVDCPGHYTSCRSNRQAGDLNKQNRKAGSHGSSVYHPTRQHPFRSRQAFGPGAADHERIGAPPFGAELFTIALYHCHSFKEKGALVQQRWMRHKTKGHVRGAQSVGQCAVVIPSQVDIGLASAVGSHTSKRCGGAALLWWRELVFVTVGAQCSVALRRSQSSAARVLCTGRGTGVRAPVRPVRCSQCCGFTLAKAGWQQCEVVFHLYARCPGLFGTSPLTVLDSPRAVQWARQGSGLRFGQCAAVVQAVMGWTSVSIAW